MTTLLITCLPHSRQCLKAFEFAKDKLEKGESVQVFFYGDGAYIANDFCWQTADTKNIADDWVALANTYTLKLPVCVSTALARGICDDDNAKRHKLSGTNLKNGFSLVGLSEFAMMISNGQLVQF